MVLVIAWMLQVHELSNKRHSMKSLLTSMNLGFKVNPRNQTKRLMLGFSLFAFLSATQPIYAQEIDCSTAVAPSIILKAVKKHAKTNASISKISKSKLSTRTYVARASLFPASVIKMQGKVQLIARNGIALSEPIELSIGASLQRGDTLRTYEQSFVSFELGDGVTSVVPSNSTITLNQANNKVARYDLQNGRVESYVPKHVKPVNSTFEIRVPNAIVGVRGTHFLVTHADGGRTKVGVEDGTVWLRSRQVCRAPVVLEAGDGIQFDKLEVEANVKPLLPAPAFKALNEAYHQNQIVFNLTPVQGAVAYQVQIANDPEFIDLKREATSNSPEPKVDMSDLGNGFYYVRSSALDASGVEGLTDNRFFLKVSNAQPAVIPKYEP